MYIIGKCKLDNQNRVNIGKFLKKYPEEVTIAVDPDSMQIAVLLNPDATDCASVTKVDPKGRIIIPKWIVEELGNPEKTKEVDLFITLDDANHRLLLSPKTGIILPQVG